MYIKFFGPTYDINNNSYVFSVFLLVTGPNTVYTNMSTQSVEVGRGAEGAWPGAHRGHLPGEERQGPRLAQDQAEQPPPPPIEEYLHLFLFIYFVIYRFNLHF